ncbi:hypothetical protein LWI29_030684 [Acer saccharum]|uniref:Leucine-rich repeat-containing N-terminal plant-type domain-containing protein n=1 Tax=Acer saccharum TaxID=4024 RepID=A0AA39SAF7_ACESA|nr:hypothetical protein LWI29_030684 [Acer saccharum]
MILVSGICQSDQQSLLLQMKNSLSYDSTSSVRLVQWNQSTDCCDMAGRVIGLDLSDESIYDGVDNSSCLFDLQHLRSLNLAFNSFNEAQIPSRLANLTNLTYLNLSNAGFEGQIPIEISSLTRLVTLDLSCYSWKAQLQLENPDLKVLVQNLSELRELYLDSVNISAHGNEWGQAFSSSLPNLQVLSLSYCYLSGPIHSSLADLQSLSVIRLDGNDLSSSVPEFLGYFPSLTILSLAHCGLFGKLSENIFKVSTLETLELSSNDLHHDSFPDFPQNNSLRTLMLHNTNLSGTLPHSIGNLKSLSKLDLGSCNFTGPLPTSMANLTQLEYLDLSANNFSGSIPSFNMSKSLNSLDLSHNVLTGGISSTDWEQLQDLSWVDLSFNF